MRTSTNGTRHDRRGGFSLIELMASLIVLVVVIAGMSQFLYLGRGTYDDEERKRTATELANRLLEDRRARPFTDSLAADTTVSIDAVSYRSLITSQRGVPATYTRRITVTTSWSSTKGKSRNVTLATFMPNHP